MSELLTVIGLALLPALGNFAGGLLAEFRRPSKRSLNRALHAAAGIVLAIVAVELLPRALQNLSGWLVGILFGVGVVPISESNGGWRDGRRAVPALRIGPACGWSTSRSPWTFSATV